MVSGVVVLAGCGGTGPDSGNSATGTVTIKDCQGRDVTVPASPRRVVTLDGYAAQAMARLGLADRIVGTGYPAPFGSDQQPFRGELEKLPVLGRNVATTEVVAAANPDLVLTGFSSFGQAPGSPSDADLETMRAKGLAACLGDEKKGAPASLASTYDFLTRLGQVFQVEARAEQVVGELRAREQAVAAKRRSDRPRVLILQDNPVAGQPLKTSGTVTIAHALIEAAGGQNAFTDVTSMHADVSPEEVLKRDPQVIWVISDYPFAKVKGEELLRQVKANPLLANTSAVRQGRVVGTSQFLVSFPTPLNLDGLEQLAAGLWTGRP
ncbi:ABC transporter substrate-binding protein [Micromonospora sagamiensis]|uniref:Iron complex transport system substrate-binding protein n=1 Tax=Micromonospora sagamiensis TaxID=47875 RepID=A0A562WCM1_9ACTN|nr:ABC transporter substrate-binding protein [Micromonospora sagamiensis]TWJ27865.1 iron complex transport system substrate-binding protein [Micromonospora sagamiensis]BCL13246.1 ABC transporter substrate-binding protein [Micromonospora sagamiensis]